MNDILTGKYLAADSFKDDIWHIVFVEAARCTNVIADISLFIHANKLHRNVIVVASPSKSNRSDCIARLLSSTSRSGFSYNCPLPFPWTCPKMATVNSLE